MTGSSNATIDGYDIGLIAGSLLGNGHLYLILIRMYPICLILIYNYTIINFE